MKPIKCFLSLGVILVFVVGVCAQDSLNHSTLSIGIGLNSLANKDNFQSPYTYRGTNLLLNAVYTKFTTSGLHMVELSYSNGQIESIVSPKAENSMLLFKYDYLFNILHKNGYKKFVPSLGFGVHSMMSNINYLPELESSNSYLTGGVFLALSGNILYHLSERIDCKMQIGIPLIGVVYRPDFEINGKTLTKGTYIGKSNFLSAKLEVLYTLNSSLKLTCAYDFGYFSFDEPRPIAILQNGFMIGIQKAF